MAARPEIWQATGNTELHQSPVGPFESFPLADVAFLVDPIDTFSSRHAWI